MRAATLNIHELGISTGASTADVHRFAKAMGCDGFIGLGEALTANVRGWVSPGSAAIQWRYQTRIDLAMDQATVAQTYMHGDDLAAGDSDADRQ